MSKTRRARRVFRGCAILATVGVLGIGASLGALWLEHRTEVTLPAPTGPFAVGRTIYAWADEGSSEPRAPVPGTRRELLVWIWYPAAARQSAAMMDDYVPAQLRAAGARTNRPCPMSPMRWLTRDPSRVHAHSLRNADVSPQQPSYPVVILRAGASAPVMNYSTLAEDLASHGYVVVGFDAPYRTSIVVFPDGRTFARTPENNPELFSGKEFTRLANKLLAAWIADVGYVLDRLVQWNASSTSGKFAGRLDMTRVGVFGHSLGGATAAQFCSEDSRCKAG